VNLVIVGPAFPLRGGIAHHVYQLHRALKKRGHLPHIISYCRLYPEFLFPGKTMIDSSKEALDAGASQVLDSINPITWLKAVRTIQDLDPALVVFEWWTPVLGPVIGTVARLLRRNGFKCIFECHNVFPHESTVLDLPMVQYGLGGGDAFIAFSRSNVSRLQALFPDKKQYYTALPAVFAHSSNATRDGRTILFFGIVRPYKGLEVLIEALPIVLGQVDCKLIIAGEFYEPLDHYLESVRRLGLEPYVEVNDRYVPNEEIPQLLDRADVLVLPYRDATQSGVLRMALSSGLPAVASNVGAFPDEIQDGVSGLLVEPGDPDSLARALINYFNRGLGPTFAQNLRSAKTAGNADELAALLESLAVSALRRA
jgi:glycosyltransferase involved in cell wall biosynthesis